MEAGEAVIAWRVARWSIVKRRTGDVVDASAQEALPRLQNVEYADGDLCVGEYRLYCGHFGIRLVYHKSSLVGARQSRRRHASTHVKVAQAALVLDSLEDALVCVGPLAARDRIRNWLPMASAVLSQVRSMYYYYVYEYGPGEIP